MDSLKDLSRSHRGTRQVRRAFLQGLVLLLFSAVPAAAQTVTGRVVGDTEAEPIRGAVVTLLDAAGQPVRSVLTNANGLFQIQGAAPGTYRLHAEMIGRKSAASEPFVVGETPTNVILALASAPIQLEGLLVEATKRCSISAEAAVATLQVWEEVRKALRAESVARELAIYEFDIRRASRTRDPYTMRMLDERVVEGKSVAQNPFRTLPAEELADAGYSKTVAGMTMIYGPTTEVLLSRGFEDTHCFSLRESRGRPGQVGLVFKPVPGRKVTDIEGVLWIHVATAELQRLEFKYRKLPSGLAMGSYSGFAEFQRLEGGAWIIGRWQLSTPGAVEEAEVSALEPIHTRQWAVDGDNAVQDPGKSPPSP